MLTTTSLYSRCSAAVRRLLPLLAAAIVLTTAATAAAQPKREFRGAWIQCVNGQFKGIGTVTMQQTLAYQLDELQKDGVNAIIFQVRPECDALYESSIEPWSYYLTGAQGERPQPYWDPLQWMTEQCHRRGMELHAWINPYRAKTKVAHQTTASHVISLHPEWTMEYDGLTLLNPALKECRDYICSVVKDILERYDVDGLHIDDYFYPYPVAGVSIPDDEQFLADPQGFDSQDDWRRNNVNLFIRQLAETVFTTKPWVKLGISPFGIYRNKKSDPNGSNTNGLQNYDQLYADVLLWDREGWMDYCVPQLYWEIGNRAADYAELIGWWNDNIQNSDLYIGEDVERTVKFADTMQPGQHQLGQKRAMHDQMDNVRGTVLWYAKAAVDNVGNYGTLLREKYWKHKALAPVVPRLESISVPGKPRKLKCINVDGKNILFWTAPKSKHPETIAERYVVYRFDSKERIDLESAANIVAITDDTFYEIPPTAKKTKAVYYVTALNRVGRESAAEKKKVKTKR